MTIQDVMYLIVSVLGIFTVIIIITRIFGLRTFAKMSSFDFASTIAVGSVLASIILNADYSLAKGAVVLFSIIGFQTLFSYLVRKNDFFKKTFTNKPQIIMYEGEILYGALKKCNVGKNDLLAKLREANVHELKDVKAVILESTGDVSVIHNYDDKQISPSLLEDVDTKSIVNDSQSK